MLDNGTMKTAEAVRSVGHAIDNAAEKAERFGISSTFIRNFLQLGFAGLVAYLFWEQSGTNKEMTANLMQQAVQQQDKTAELFRDESKEQRTATRENAKLLREGLNDVKKAVEQNTEEIKRSQAASLEEIKKLVKNQDCRPR